MAWARSCMTTKTVTAYSKADAQKHSVWNCARWFAESQKPLRALGRNNSYGAGRRESK